MSPDPARAGGARTPGLDEEEAAARLAAEGPNAMPEPPAPGLARIAAGQAADPMVLLLLAAAALSVLVLGDDLAGAAILAIVVVNVAISTWQRHRADAAVRALRSLAAPTARVRRAGRARVVPAAEVVRGDVVELAAGDRVPADAVLRQAEALAADESMLTGESLPVEKAAGGPTDPALPAGDRAGLAFAGTLVVRGRGVGEVVATGAGTLVGALAGSLGPSPPPPLEAELRQVAWRIAGAAVVAGLALLAAVLLREGLERGALLQAVLAGIALAVAAIPEGLVAIVTTSLALGARRMAARGTIVRDLRAIEALGSSSVLCVDKTGTLTEGRLAVAGAEAAGGAEGALWAAAQRCNDAAGGVGDPVDVALAEEARRRGQPEPAGERVAERPFDPLGRQMSTVHRTAGGPVLSVKGAPEVVLARCAPGPARAALEEAAPRMAREGHRVLAVADGPTADLGAGGLRALGLVAFADPPRASARPAVEACRRAGIRVVMVTGDHPATARAVAAAVGLDAAQVVTGAELARLPPGERAGRLAAAGVVARVDPSVKVDLVEAHRARGGVVAMTGDGVNDAPALRRADVGIAVAGAGGTDAAREASDLVVTDGDLGTLVAAVREGRSIFRNLRNVVAYLLTGNTSEVALVLAGLVLLPELAVPLLPVQLLWINLVTDGFPALALGLDRAPGDPLAAPPRARGERLLGLGRLGALVARGGVVAALVMGATLLARAWGLATPQLQTQLLLVLLACHLVLAYVVRSDGPAFGRGWWRNPALLAAVGGSLAVHALFMATPALRPALGLVPLPWWGWALALAAAAATVLVLDGLKLAAGRASRAARLRARASAG